MKYLVYYKTIEDTHRCLYDDGLFETLKYLPKTTEVHNFHTFKGHENYQIINDQKKYFSDQKVSKFFLK